MPSAKPTKKSLKKRRLHRLKQSSNAFLARRPHRSFRRTKRRDYKRSLQLPSYFTFTRQVVRHLFLHKKIFVSLIALYSVVTIFLVGISSQETFTQLGSVLKDTGGSLFSGGFGQISKATLLFTAVITGGNATQLSQSQQLYAAILFILVWLTTIWLLRAQFVGKTPKLRDALYSAGAPIVSSTVIVLLFVLQLVPAGIGVAAYSAFVQTGQQLAGVLSMVIALVALGLIILSVYLLTSTFFALVVVTLPGMYPWQALRIAGDLVIGRRLRILLRIVWLVALIALFWVIIMVPLILIVSYLNDTFDFFATLPVVPFSLVVLSSLTTVFSATYVYMLYRKVVDDDANPA